MKIHFCNATEPEKKFYSAQLADHQLTFSESVSEFLEMAESSETSILSVFAGDMVNSETISQLSNLKLIATRSTGYDHIDLTVSEKNDVTVVNVPEYGSRTVAEYTFSLLLAISRSSFGAYQEMRSTGKIDLEVFEGFDLYGKTLGVIGTGKIGSNVCRIAAGFGMKILAVDKYPKEELTEELNLEYVELENLLQNSDILTLHAPLNDSTHHLIDKSMLDKMQNGAVLLNTARGGLVDTAALVQALSSGKLSAAGLDVIEGENHLEHEVSLLSNTKAGLDSFKQLAMAHALLDMDNVILTPHIAYNTHEAKREIMDTTVENIESYINGEVINQVTSK